MVQLLKTIKAKLKNWYDEMSMTAEERWLSQSNDVVELENRMRILYNSTRNKSCLGGKI